MRGRIWRIQKNLGRFFCRTTLPISVFQLFHLMELYSINWISPLSVARYQKEPYLFHSSTETTIMDCLYTEVGIVGDVGGAALKEYIYSPPTKLREWWCFQSCVSVNLSVHWAEGGFMWPLSMIHCTILYRDQCTGRPWHRPCTGTPPGSAPPLGHVQTCSSWSMYDWQAGSGILLECFLVSWELGRANE